MYGFEARGLRQDECPLESVPEIAADYLAQARRLRQDGPWLLAGWSVGAVVAAEMARQLDEQGQRVELLALLDPATSAVPAGDDEATLLAELLRHEARLSGEDIAIDPAVLAIMAPPARREEVLARLHRAHVLPAAAGEPELSRLLGVFAGHRRALRRYQPMPYRGSAARVVDLPEDGCPVLRHPAVAAELARHLERT